MFFLSQNKNDFHFSTKGLKGEKVRDKNNNRQVNITQILSLNIKNY